MSPRTINFIAVLAFIAVGMAACDNKGPVEQAVEEVDEAVDTVKNGEESTASKVDDAVDDLREGTKEAKDDLKGK